MVVCGSVKDIEQSLIHLDAAVRLMRQRTMDKCQDKAGLAFIVQLKFFTVYPPASLPT